MLRIGMIGSESTHALTFAGMMNLPDADGRFPFGDVRVTEICGGDAEQTREVAEKGRILHIARQPQEMVGRVDAVMVVPRDGSLHCRYALSFIEAGIPTWVDKPFTVDYGEALRLTRAAKERGTPLTGGSLCRFSEDVLALRARFERIIKGGGAVYSAGFNFPCDIHSEYGGLYFYASHAAEILYAIFGGRAVSVSTDLHCGNLLALVRYRDFTVTINFAPVSQYYGMIYSSAGVAVQPIDISAIYGKGLEDFLEILKRKRAPADDEQLLFPVRFLHALDGSVRQNGAETAVDGPEQ